MNTRLYVNKINNYKKCMKVLECAHCIFIDEIETFEFKKITGYSKARYLYNKIAFDFKQVNKLIKDGDLFNAATILRTLYENIIFIIATSYDSTLHVTLDSAARDFRKILEDNCDKLFSDFFRKEDFNNIYKYLCKIVHPTSLKELVSYLSSTAKYKDYMLNNLKYIMVMIEYMYLNYLNKKVFSKESQFDLNLIDLCTYINLVNISYFLKSAKNGIMITKRYMLYDTNNNYVEENKKICDELKKEINEKSELINKDVKELTQTLNAQISNSKYEEIVIKILG